MQSRVNVFTPADREEKPFHVLGFIAHQDHTTQWPVLIFRTFSVHSS